MALLFCDGFDNYIPNSNTATPELMKKWTSWILASDIIADVSPNWARQIGNGQGLKIANNAQRGVFKNLPSTYATLIVGGWFYFPTVPNTSAGFLQIVDLGTEQIGLRGNGAGKLTVVRGGGTVLATSTNNIVINTWYHIEMRATIHNTTGIYEVRVNGTSTGWVPQATGANTRQSANNYGTGIGLTNDNDVNMRFDDVYCLDTSTSVANDFIGPSRIITIYPNSAGNYSAFTPNYAANFANVNEGQYDGDITFNQSGTSGNKDTFGFDDIPTATIYGIHHNVLVRQDAGTQRTVRVVQRSGGTDYAGSVQTAVPGSWILHNEAVSVNPATSAAYTTSDINAAEFGYENV